MPATQIFSLNNTAVAAAPPSYFFSHPPQIQNGSVGVPIPAGKTSWQLAIDLGGTIPAGQPFGVTVQYQRHSWTDADGVVHPEGEWLDDASATMTTGSYTPKSGVPTTVNFLASSIGAIDTGGGMVEPYPIAARVRISQSGAWTIPNITLTLS